MRWKPRTIRVRLALWYAGALALVLLGSATTVYLLVRASLLRHVDDRLRHDLGVVGSMLGEYAQDPGEIEEHGLVSLYAVVEGGSTTFASDGWRRQGLPEPADVAAGSGAASWESADERHYAFAVGRADAGGRDRTLVVGTEEGTVRRTLATLALILVFGVPAVIVAAVGGGLFLAGRALAPAGRLADAAGRITAERLSERLPVDDPGDEFGRLSAVFNAMLARLEEGFLRLRRFTTDASHELRTPLTALRSVGEVALRDARGAEQYKETIASMLEETERLTRLVDGLLLLTREDRAAYRTRFEELELGTLAREAVDLLKVLAEEKGQELSLERNGAVHVLGDRATLGQAVINLLDNAIKYTPRGGTITVSVTRPTTSQALLDVADQGPGIAPEHTERVFERFYRVDRDRSRASGGTGLGLAIARWAAELHGGTIELESAPGRGSSFRMRLPVAGTGAPRDARSRPLDPP